MFLPIKEFSKTLMIWQHVDDIDEERLVVKVTDIYSPCLHVLVGNEDATRFWW